MENTNNKKIISINGLIDEDQCYQKVQELRWSEEVKCPWCDSSNIVKNGHNSKFQVFFPLFSKKYYIIFLDFKQALKKNIYSYV